MQRSVSEEHKTRWEPIRWDASNRLAYQPEWREWWISLQPDIALLSFDLATKLEFRLYNAWLRHTGEGAPCHDAERTAKTF